MALAHPLRALVAALTLTLALTFAGCAVPAPSPTPSRLDSAAPAAPSAVPAPPAASAPSTTASDPTARAGWRLVWSDEFGGPAVDTSKWTILDNSTFGEGNDELACLLADNVAVRDGALVVTAAAPAAPVYCGNYDKRFPGGRSYTSGFLETKGKASFQYGRFEIRAWTPTAPGASKGLWPAFWLRPENGDRGELDVMELLGTSADNAGQRNRVMQTIHDTYGGPHAPEYVDYDVPGQGLDTGFHTYAVEWEPGVIRWYVDDRLTFQRDRSTTPWIDEAFNGPFFLRINLAVGGAWPGSPDSNTAFPAQYRVDWVRVYQR